MNRNFEQYSCFLFEFKSCKQETARSILQRAAIRTFLMGRITFPLGNVCMLLYKRKLLKVNTDICKPSILNERKVKGNAVRGVFSIVNN